MKNCNSIVLRVFIKHSEDFTKIKNTLISLVPFDIKKEKILFTENNATGFDGKNISILEITLEKDRHINQFLKNFINILKESNLLQKIKLEPDQNLNFSIRLDKEELIKNNFKIIETGDCFYLKLSIAAFPKTFDNAKTKLAEIFNS